MRSTLFVATILFAVLISETLSKPVPEDNSDSTNKNVSSKFLGNALKELKNLKSKIEEVDQNVEKKLKEGIDLVKSKVTKNDQNLNATKLTEKANDKAEINSKEDETEDEESDEDTETEIVTEVVTEIVEEEGTTIVYEDEDETTTEVPTNESSSE